jgi:hypothetical protein
MKQNSTFTSLKTKWQIRVVALFMLLFSANAIQAQCTGTTIAFTWGGGLTYNYAYDGIRNGKCAFKQQTPGTTIEWNGTQWCIYGNNAYLGTIFWHSTVDVGDRPSNNVADWVADMSINMISLTGTGTIDHPTVVGPTSQVKANQCASTLAMLDSNINADYVAGYEAYRFEVSNGLTVNTVDVNKYNFSLTQTPGITFGTTYGVRVAVKMGGVWGPFGSSCNVSTPVFSSSTILPTKVHPAFCGTTLAALTTKIPAKPIQDATGYRFEITTGGVTTVYDSSSYNFRLADAGVAAYGTTYSIRVAALVNGIYGDYGVSCDVTTPVIVTNTVPTTNIIPSLCGTTLATLSSKITAVMVTGATNGRYEITKAGSAPVVYEVASTVIQLAQTGVVVDYNTAYTIRVAAFVGGVWGNYGTSCTVTTPAAPGGKLMAKTFEVSAYPNPYDTAFNLNLETPSKENVTIAVYNMMGKLVETHQVNPMEIANLQLGSNFSTGIYNVIVSQGDNSKAVRLIRK